MRLITTAVLSLVLAACGGTVISPATSVAAPSASLTPPASAIASPPAPEPTASPSPSASASPSSAPSPSAQVPEGFTLYEHPDGLFSIVLPDAWDVELFPEAPGMEFLLNATSPIETTHLSIIRQREALADRSLADYVQELRVFEEALAHGTGVLSEVPLPNGIAARFEVKASDSGRTDVNFSLADGTDVWRLLFTTDGPAPDPAVDVIAESLTLND